MPDLPLLPIGGGVLAGLSVAVLVFSLIQIRRRRQARSVLEAARAEAGQLLDRTRQEAERAADEGRRAVEAARADALLAAKVESLRLREDLDRETHVRREEWDRVERRAEERERSHDRRHLHR